MSSPPAVTHVAPKKVSRWGTEPSFSETLALWLASALIFVAFLSALSPYSALVNNFGDSRSYIDVAHAIRTWDFHGLAIKHFWGLPYFMAALSRMTKVSDLAALLLVSFVSSAIAVMLAYRLWGGWVASAFAILNFDWYQRSYLGGSEPLFVALLFGSFLAIRRERWWLAALLAALATITRPLGIFLLLGIGLTLLWQRKWPTFVLVTGIGMLIGALYVTPLAVYFHDPLATVHSYESTRAAATVPLFGIPFFAIIKGTILYPAPVSNLLLSFAWIFFVSVGVVAMAGTRSFRLYAREHVAEMLFAVPYLLSLYCYNYPVYARGTFARFAIPVIPFVLIALGRWLPKDRRILWLLTPVTAVLAACSALGMQNLAYFLKWRG